MMYSVSNGRIDQFDHECVSQYLDSFDTHFLGCFCGF